MFSLYSKVFSLIVLSSRVDRVKYSDLSKPKSIWEESTMSAFFLQSTVSSAARWTHRDALWARLREWFDGTRRRRAAFLWCSLLLSNCHQKVPFTNNYWHDAVKDVNTDRWTASILLSSNAAQMYRMFRLPDVSCRSWDWRADSDSLLSNSHLEDWRSVLGPQSEGHSKEHNFKWVVF